MSLNGHIIMELTVVGLNHRTAPVSLRERVAFHTDQLARALPALKEAGSYTEVAILSTCNRTEALVYGQHPNPKLVVEWLSEFHNISIEELTQSTYSYEGKEAIFHIMRLACGLDSMVLGEPQIFGQFKDCFNQAKIHNTIGPNLHNLSQTANRIAKLVRTKTGIGENTVSIASTSVTLAKQLFAEISKCNALLIGAGETIELVVQHLRNAGLEKLVISNRTFANAQEIAQKYKAQALDLTAIPEALENSDIVISSTGSPMPILGKGTVERALKKRRHKPILMVDLAVPRDIEPEVSSLQDVYLYSIDDLQNIIIGNIELRKEAADEAENLIKHSLREYFSKQTSAEALDTLRRFRKHHENFKQLELQKALANLARGDNPEAVVTKLANQLTNKIIHGPSLKIKESGSFQGTELLNVIENIFLLKDEE